MPWECPQKGFPRTILCRNLLVSCQPQIGGYGVRGGKRYAAYARDWNGGASSRPRWHLVCAGVAALAFGFVLGLQALPGRVMVSETSRPKNPDLRASLGSPVPDQQPWRLASLESTVVYLPAAED